MHLKTWKNLRILCLSNFAYNSINLAKFSKTYRKKLGSFLHSIFAQFLRKVFSIQCRKTCKFYEKTNGSPYEISRYCDARDFRQRTEMTRPPPQPFNFLPPQFINRMQGPPYDVFSRIEKIMTKFLKSPLWFSKRLAPGRWATPRFRVLRIVIVWT